MKLDRIVSLPLAAAARLALGALGCMFALCCMLPLGCAPASPPAPASPRASPPASPAEAASASASIVVAAPPSTAAGGSPEATGAPPPGVLSTPGAGASTSPVPPSDLACVAPPDPQFDRESPWSKAVGERLERELPRLAHCSNDLPTDEAANVTLRFIYSGDGTPRSQHIVAGAGAGCAAAACVQRALAAVRAPKLVIEQGAFDLPLILERGVAPRRTQDERAGLTEQGEANDPASCIDPIAARLSRSAVDEIVRTTFVQLESCYAHAISRRHDAAGTVTFEFVIGLEGEVALVQARESTLYDCEAIECMLAPFRQLGFPPPLGRSVRIIYPIRYSIEQPPVQLR
jgi:hypothetical protein